MAPEGRIILLPLLILAVVAGVALLWMPRIWLQGVAGLLWALAGLSIIFFRDPVRQPPQDSLAVVAPADGKIVAIQRMEFDQHVGGEALQISIFLSIFDVHVQRVPADGVVDSIRHQSGKFLAAFRPGAGEVNAQTITYMTGERAKFVVKQIAGAVARRIISHLRTAERVARGDRLGYIRFGSRVILIVPADFQLKVVKGQKVKGGVSVMGYFTP